MNCFLLFHDRAVAVLQDDVAVLHEDDGVLATDGIQMLSIYEKGNILV